LIFPRGLETDARCKTQDTKNEEKLDVKREKGEVPGIGDCLRRVETRYFSEKKQDFVKKLLILCQPLGCEERL
jgi:hypothetical protein